MNNQEIHDYHNYTQFYQPAIDQGVLNETEKIHIDCGNYTDRRLIEEISTLQQTKRPRQSIPQREANGLTVRNGSGTSIERNRSQSTLSFRPETLTNADFIPAYLTQYIGKWIRADFLIGDSIEQRVGILEDVGASYIILNAIEPDTLVVCDLFAIKFVTIILNDEEYPKLLL